MKYLSYFFQPTFGVAIMLLFFLENATAQPFKTGLIIDHAYSAQFGNLSDEDYEGSKSADLAFIKDLKPNTPTPGNQGTNGSCVGWAVGYSGYTSTLAAKKGLTDKNTITESAFSAMYIYNQVYQSDCSTGARLEDALNLLKKKGDCKQSEFRPSTCQEAPNSEQHKVASSATIKDFAPLYNYTASPASKIEKTKIALNEGYPVIIGMNVRNNIFDLKPGTEYWDPNAGNTDYAGGHAMVVVGYNEAKQTFELLNSWGTNWGDNGYCKVKYKDFGELCEQAYIIIPNDTPIPPKENSEPAPTAEKTSLAGNFAFRFPTSFDANDKPIFDSAKVQFVNDHFELDKKDWEVGQMFQLATKNTKKGEYLYVFSINPSGELHIHRPRSEKVDASKFYGMIDVPIKPFLNTEVIIPSTESALSIEAAGDDFVCVLYSSKEISDFKERTSKLAAASGDFMSRLQTGFGDIIIPKENIQYKSNDGLMSFTSQSSSGIAVPLVLKVTAK